MGFFGLPWVNSEWWRLTMYQYTKPWGSWCCTSIISRPTSSSDKQTQHSQQYININTETPPI
jgi:hypothetical protein